jgi:hypothetical protein
MRFLCCLGWLLLSPLLLVVWYLCILLALLLGRPTSACDTYLNKVRDLAKCCAGGK